MLSASVVAGVGSTELGVLPKSAVFTGCGCSFTTLPDPPDLSAVVFSSEYEGSGRVLLGGKIVDLAAVGPAEKCWPSRLGGQCRLKYRGDEVIIVIDARATWICPKDDESCEVVQLKGKLTTHVGDDHSVIEVHGECGC